MSSSNTTLPRHTLDNPLKTAVLISGGGTTLCNLLEQIDAKKLPIEVVRVISSNRKAKGIQYAEERNIPCQIITVQDHPEVADFSEAIFHACREAGAELVVMGGFLKQIAVPGDFQGRVMNIHPSLIPAFCGAGYYGLHVHRAVLEHGAKISGCTVHFVDDHYDHGPIIAQRAIEVEPDDTPESLAQRIFTAECQIYPEMVTAYAEGRIRVDGRRVRVDESLPQGAGQT